MRIAILIVFSYIDSEESDIRWRLPGIEIDLYQYYHFVKKMNPDKILLITDITKNFIVSSVTTTISKGIVDANILSLIDEIKRDGNYWNYTYKNEMILKIQNVAKDAHELFIYYTGHGHKNNFVLPNIMRNFTYYDENIDKQNSDLYNANDFMNDILSSFNGNNTIIGINEMNENKNNKDKKKIFMILDCCQISSMGLPFKLSDEEYHFLNRQDTIFTRHEIICLTSSLFTENSISVNHGSVFSRSIYKIFQKINLQNIYSPDYRLLSNILEELTLYTQEINSHVSKLVDGNLSSANIYSSYPNLYFIWSWLFGVQDRFKIEFDITSSSIQLTYLH